MKKIALLFIASVAGLVVNASAAANSNETEVLVMPKYVVTAPRLTEAEKKVAANLDELRAQANLDATVSAELPYIKAPALTETAIKQLEKDVSQHRVAKN